MDEELSLPRASKVREAQRASWASARDCGDHAQVLQNVELVAPSLTLASREALEELSRAIKNERCTICLERIDEGEGSVVDRPVEARVLGCRHGFHRECVDAWLLFQVSAYLDSSKYFFTADGRVATSVSEPCCPLCKNPVQILRDSDKEAAVGSFLGGNAFHFANSTQLLRVPTTHYNSSHGPVS